MISAFIWKGMNSLAIIILLYSRFFVKNMHSKIKAGECNVVFKAPFKTGMTAQKCLGKIVYVCFRSR